MALINKSGVASTKNVDPPRDRILRVDGCSPLAWKSVITAIACVWVRARVMCVCVCVCACMRACTRVCVRVCVHGLAQGIYRLSLIELANPGPNALHHGLCLWPTPKPFSTQPPGLWHGQEEQCIPLLSVDPPVPLPPSAAVPAEMAIPCTTPPRTNTTGEGRGLMASSEPSSRSITQTSTGGVRGVGAPFGIEGQCHPNRFRRPQPQPIL